MTRVNPALRPTHRKSITSDGHSTAKAARTHPRCLHPYLGGICMHDGAFPSPNVRCRFILGCIHGPARGILRAAWGVPAAGRLERERESGRGQHDGRHPARTAIGLHGGQGRL